MVALTQEQRPVQRPELLTKHYIYGVKALPLSIIFKKIDKVFDDSDLVKRRCRYQLKCVPWKEPGL